MTTNRNLAHEYFCSIVNSIIKALYEAELPIVFKGMAVTRLILKDNNVPYIRETEDIDGDWTGEPISLIDMENCINDALKVLDNIYVKAY